jgi:outer membrane protein assembly factor BamB
MTIDRNRTSTPSASLERDTDRAAGNDRFQRIGATVHRRTAGHANEPGETFRGAAAWEIGVSKTRVPAFCVLLAALCALAGASPAPPAGTTQRWALAIDSRNTGQWLSVRRGVVYCVRNAHVTAIDVATGHVHWASSEKVEGRPAIGGRTVFAPVPSGVVALDAATGRELGRFRLPGAPEMLTTDSTAVAVVNGDTHGRLLGFRDHVQPRWQREFIGSWGRPEDVGRSTILVWGGRSGDDSLPAAFWESSAAVLALDATTGNAMAATDGVEDYVGRNERTLWFSVVGGGLKSLDLATNTSASIHNSIVRGAVRVEGATAVAVVDGHLTKISLPDGRQERLRIDGRWVGGPADQTIFVAREDGTYALRLSGGRPIRLVTNTAHTRFLTSTGKSVYFAVDDGCIVVANLDNPTLTTRLKTACRFVEGVHVIDRGALVHCDDARWSSRLYAFRFAGQH